MGGKSPPPEPRPFFPGDMHPVSTPPHAMPGPPGLPTGHLVTTDSWTTDHSLEFCSVHGEQVQGRKGSREVRLSHSVGQAQAWHRRLKGSGHWSPGQVARGSGLPPLPVALPRSWPPEPNEVQRKGPRADWEPPSLVFPSGRTWHGG